ncbi:hypothetical protein A2641_03460 [Candidatus Nomurabacteria bacterium RIFCSPHIGHO2_01_FULL_37_25]|uniref:Methyltransferase type 11 domain-containing protein n=1 Tax=Candidatus Nomurabacteria bacterium RIFCSPLOWO2_01_FULL_36_16 TaxID=1801767 RepID=A0A1F6X066_9BACT|nr:MAG: hypothetical protein A2641_03460 [Candidatus Nomurabacteria bacterium RIFCSPHIGHO2_01_FULL_37_25]OGI75547.1 MAG: hypothetical protein A3D36_03105 [Candidatus Nomurabacteria bacterium RIFCSPHIGHO2_02_FULL_36_29]OGI87385.1 MAG: hypothetical protein A3A91_02725 [Candidatus Nomurabacteria bacterium RIFCSPLOWO2_01_FULL_36_16]OGI96864.1 MAG: hypothetical protein A3I84_03040 [Candidatus Nomurabacteria bacterium RIFCSPLOWO2_02_FULL_36_8]
MEEEPKKLPREVLKPNTQNSGSWEYSYKNGKDDNLKSDFEHLEEMMLKDRGVDLKKAKVLELGSGNGFFLDYMISQGVDAVGLDIRPRSEGSKSSQVIARIEQLPFADESFDVVYSQQIFDSKVYDQNQTMMFREIFRVLKHGGIYFGALEFLSFQIDGFIRDSNKNWDIYKKL